MSEAGKKKEDRFSVTFFDGLNSSVQSTLAKRTELFHGENARSTKIGQIEKREGQTPKGTSPQGNKFIATNNYGLIYFPTTNSTQTGVFRVSASGEPTQTLTLSVFDQVYVNEVSLSGSFSSPDFSIKASTTTFQTFTLDSLSIAEPSFSVGLEGDTTSIDNIPVSSDIYSLSTNDTWIKLSDADAQSIIGGQFDFTVANKDLIMVNQVDKNRLLSKDGSTVTTSSDAGSLYNSPNAAKTCFYKNRIYLTDYLKNGVSYPTTILRSSYPLGIIALVEGDHEAAVTTLNVTDTKYFYTTAGMNTYDIYRGGTKIETVTVSTVNETSLTIGPTSNAINSSDEIWIAGTYAGAKQHRWINNPTASGRNVKQYDTFSLSGGEEDAVTLFETIGNVLFIGNKKALATWDDYTLTNIDLGVGCISTNGHVKLLGTLYFLSHKGVLATTGGPPTLISRKIDRYVQGATKEGLENSAMGTKNLSVFVTIGDVTLYKKDGSLEKTLTDVCLEYSVTDQNWYVHTNVPIKEFRSFISEEGVEHLLGFHEGNSKSVVEFLKGSTDDGEEIFFRADTQEIQLLKEFETFASPLSVVTETSRGSQLKSFVSLDGEDFYEIEGIVKKGASIVKINSRDAEETEPVLCRKIQISYRDSSKQRCQINQFAIIYVPTTMDLPSD